MDVLGESSTQYLPYSRKTCPFLGLQGDPELRFGYPSLGNRCHHLKPLAKITPGYQETWCLSGNFKNCAVYLGASNDHLPEGIDPIPQGISPAKALILASLFMVMVASIISLFFLVWGGNRNNNELKVSLKTTEFAGSLDLTPQSNSMPLPSSPTPTTRPSPTFTLFPTVAPTLTSTPALPTQAAALETPFGPGGEFVLHKVRAGESLRNIAAHYKMNLAVLKVINESSHSGLLLVDKILVVIPNLSDNPGLPVFHPIFLDQEASVSALAEQYGIQAEDLRYYNSLGSSDLIPAGRWMIIPLPPSRSP